MTACHHQPLRICWDLSLKHIVVWDLHAGKFAGGIESIPIDDENDFPLICISLPPTITDIKEGAFHNCTSLLTINSIPFQSQQIGLAAFANIYGSNTEWISLAFVGATVGIKLMLRGLLLILRDNKQLFIVVYINIYNYFKLDLI